MAESIFFSRITTGAHDDLTKVTKMAYSQVRVFIGVRGVSDVIDLTKVTKMQVRVFIGVRGVSDVLGGSVVIVTRLVTS